MSQDFPLPIYSDDRTYPVAPYNPSAYTSDTNDTTIPTKQELASLLSTSTPGGNVQINGIRAPRLTGDQLYIQGKAYVKGSFGSELKLDKQLLLADGTPTIPSIGFQSSLQTGIYGPSGNQIGFTVGGFQQVTIGTSGLNLYVPITTPTGQNLILNPGGSNVDFGGHKIINAVFPPTGVIPGSYTNTNITVNAAGLITSASNGSGGSSVYAEKIHLISSEIKVSNVNEVNISYMPWHFASWSTSTVQKVYSWVAPGNGTKNLTIRVRDFSGAVLGSTTINGGQPTGMYTFTLTMPVIDTRISISVERSQGNGSSPIIYGMIFEAA